MSKDADKKVTTPRFPCSDEEMGELLIILLRVNRELRKALVSIADNEYTDVNAKTIAGKALGRDV